LVCFLDITMGDDKRDFEKEEFTYTYYEAFLSRLLKVYKFIGFPEGKRAASTISGDEISRRPLAIMRHDIDMDPNAALPISLIEKETGLRATYFFMVRCPIYNIFSPEYAGTVMQIIDSGHRLGLHFDCAMYLGLSRDKISSQISREVELLEGFFKAPVEAVSFHRPGEMELNGIELERWPNTYERVFRETFQYFSDSRGRWARGNPLKSKEFSKRSHLHILVHPIWWGEKADSPINRLAGVVNNNKIRAEKYMYDNCDVWKADIGRVS
jgi:hypothetical protein